jgi:hypothetical protein
MSENEMMAKEEEQLLDELSSLSKSTISRKQ